ncbi:benzylsuccinate CoA-transferase BbsF subunit [Humitalea rosea]|uniref:Benzylsuccinate CoA-transferase BbsF subunit n=1 Tax=Humitalea rosea TaxID=990373 RepID=A0A2W7IMH7_9PROT|nr:CoA transferase [Humitalea rosea]PZW48050.1 benzylsuccinate CoA-transferase BbsF subunit [Humitalea rosea]
MKADFLRGIRFADLTWAGAGPFSTKIFADFGAEVIKVESATRVDPVRLGGPFRDGIPGVNRSGYFASRNTGKRSVALNLKAAEGRAVVRDLIRTADVVSNNFGPGAMERLGLGYEEVRRIRPDVIYLSMPMYGEDGPLSNLLGVGMTISAVTGLMSLTGYHDGPPLGPGTHFPDHAANPYHAAFAVLAALRYRRRTGRGMKIDLAQVESTINCVGPAVLDQAITGQEPQRVGNRSARHAPHNVFRCKGEDRWCAVTVLTDAQWLALARTIGAEALAADPQLATAAGRVARADELEAAVTRWTRLHEAEAVMSALQAAGVPAGVVADPRSLIEQDPQLRHRGYWQRLDHPELKVATYTSPPFRLDGERVELTRPPLIGEHTDAVLAGILGYDAARIAALRASGTIEA